MNNNPALILTKVLSIIEYKDDKKIFIREFLILCLQQTIIELIKNLPKEQQSSLNKELLNQKDKEIISRVAQKYFPDGQFNNRLLIVTQKLFTDYIETVIPVLSGNQKNSLLFYLSSIKI